MQHVWLWVSFSVVAAAILIIDLAVLHRKPHAVRTREAAIWSAVWVSAALLFNLVILLKFGSGKGLEFLTGYLIELSLSVDNIFVFVIIFAYFRVPYAYQHRVLFWGILGAVVLRATFIFGGIALLNAFQWLVYVLGAVLLWASYKLFRSGTPDVHPEKNRTLSLFRRIVPMTTDYHGAQFFANVSGREMATPLMAVLIVVETTDVVFAVDSIPAILAITKDPLIVFTSNICAILGLRSFYFLFAALVKRLRYLHFGLAAILGFVGLKMILSHKIDIAGIHIPAVHIPTSVSLGFVAAALLVAIVASLGNPVDASEPSDERESAERR